MLYLPSRPQYLCFIYYFCCILYSTKVDSGGKTNLKIRAGISFASIILIAIVIFLATDIGFSLYNPDRLSSLLPFSTLSIIGGKIQVQTKDSLAWEKAEDGMMLEPGSRVRTAPDSYASISFAQGATTKLEPGTDLIIAKLENNQDKKPDTVVLQQQSGRTWNQVAKIADDNYHFQIQTPSADVKVRGTLFATEVDESGKTIVQTTEGAVNVSAQGQEVQVPAGQQTMVKPGAAPSLPAPMPPARNELVFTIGKPAVGMVIDPSGSSTGYLTGGAPLNQISGSQVSLPGDSSQTVRIREPHNGEYTVILRGVTDSKTSLNVEGFVEGKKTFAYSESCNITSINGTVLKLHVDVLNGLMAGVSLLSPRPPESGAGETVAALEPAPEEAGDNKGKSTPSEKENTPAQKETWFNIGGYKVDKWAVITSIVVLLAGILVIVWRKS
jgi:uncharacterized protein (DUF736 family)